MSIRLARRLALWLMAAGTLLVTPWVGAESPADRVGDPVQELIFSTGNPAIQALLQDIYNVNPELARARAAARGDAERPAQVRALPDPTLGIAAFLLPPETRTGPQRLSATFGQRIPYKGKRRLREDAARQNEAASRALAEELALRKISEARRLLVRLAYLEQAEAIVQHDLSTLAEFEEISRARYATGSGIAQAVIKLQAEITRARTRLLTLAEQRAGYLATLNALRARPASEEFPSLALGSPRAVLPASDLLHELAVSRSPRVQQMRERIRLAGTKLSLARKEYRPDLSVGMTYTLVDRRGDQPGILFPPPGNGDDILSVAATINLPIRRKRLDAGVRQALEARNEAEHALSGVVLELDRELADHLARYPLLVEQWHLLEAVLYPQAAEALESARYGYETTRIDLLDLLDAERVLLEVRLGVLRAVTEMDILIVDLERTIAGPLPEADGIEVRHDDENE